MVVESTFSWYWLVDGLMEAGYRVHRVNVTAIKKHEGLSYANDKTGAAYLGKLKLLPEGGLCSGRGDRTRDFFRKRACLAHCRTVWILDIESAVLRPIAVRLSSQKVKALSGEKVMAMPLPHNIKLAVNAHTHGDQREKGRRQPQERKQTSRVGVLPRRQTLRERVITC